MKHHPKTKVLHPSPWDYGPAAAKAKPEGPRYRPEVMMETNKPVDIKTGKRSHSKYYNANKGEHGIATGYSDKTRFSIQDKPRPGDHKSIYTADEVIGIKYNDARNVHVETDFGPAPQEHVCVKMVNHPAEQFSLPFRDADGIKTPISERGGRRHNDADMKDTAKYVHDNKLHAKPYRPAGEVIPVETKNNVIFERHTGVRRSKSMYQPERAPMGLEHNWDRHNSVRKHTIHYDTRNLLTFA